MEPLEDRRLLALDVELVQDFNMLPAAPAISLATNVGDRLLFFLSSPSIGRLLWRNDGTPAGTGVVKHLSPYTYPWHSDPDVIWARPAESLLYFLRPSENGDQLWRNDGTSDGTFPVLTLSGGIGGREGETATIGDTLFFKAYTEETGLELWTSDGSIAGTKMVHDVKPGPESSVSISSGSPIVNGADGKVYFAATDPVHGGELWSSDGTLEGTTIVADIWTGEEGGLRVGWWGGGPHSLAVTEDGLLFFPARDAEHGTELWAYRSDLGGSPFLVADLAEGEEFLSLGSTSSFLVAGSSVLFAYATSS